ncbi:ATP-binding cassette domain-containing protein [Micromonospora yasonensis]|uniref:ATP-binding cassette domain-containing protein n=1 Tax=Micromonospora yasonensis TaxID=1128667 RepID=UPI002232AB76|nr:ATP-binding cassette domain-containing protein [Micromonospora yasonensis]MCW3839879.1 ATP-binding cassette domain-containing protein [Micromonospora yasonensis]
MTQPLLDVRGLVVEYGHGPGLHRAVDDVSFRILRGGSLAVVGESGSGKSTIARALVRLVKPAAGSITFDGVDLAGLTERQLRPLRHRIQMVFQDPYGSLDPHLDAQDIVAEPIAVRGERSRGVRQRRAAELLDRVGLPRSALHRKPHEFSGGQRQRIGIARALASEPDLLVCDEATSALDVSVQAQVLDILGTLRREQGLTFLFISHNLGVVRAVSDEVLVLRTGRVVEQGATEEVLQRPRDEYTRRLRRSVLEPALITGRKPRELVRQVAAARAAESAVAS